jgi:malonyl-CoA/methylmalonyl-CoA synthetase
MTLNQLFDLSLGQRCDHIALEWQGRDFTFGEIGARARRMANALRIRGFQPGDRLAVQLANCVEAIDLYLACLRLGVIFVPVNVLYREREVTHILQDAAPRFFVTRDNLAALLAEAGAASEDCPTAALDGDSPAALVYTSGTTGASKGAILTHNNFAVNALNLLACWQITSADRFLHAAALPCARTGQRPALLADRRLPHAPGRALRAPKSRYRISGFPADALLRGADHLHTAPRNGAGDSAHDRARHAAVRLGLGAAAAASAGTFSHAVRHTILERYGMTETLMNISNPYAGERRQGSVGFSFPGVSVRLLDAAGAPVASGETGEICLRGPNVFAGYWQKEDATKAAFRDGWFRTGDLASVSPDGYYNLCGRRSDLIICGGFNVYPREIEEFLMEQPEVAEAAVAGVPDGIKGEVPVAWIVVRGDFDPATLEARCRRELASFKVPRAFLRVDGLPRNALGKVQKHLLPRP